VEASRSPVIVGVGELVGDRAGPRGRPLEAAREPLALIEAAVRAAASDAAPDGPAAILAAVDAIHAVRTTSWAYDDAARQLAVRVGASPRHLVDTTVGGHWPTRLLERAAARIAAGEDRLALLVGGEAQASVTALAKGGLDPATDAGWSTSPGGPPAFDPSDLGSPRMVAAGTVLPTRVYPMFQHALLADLGVSLAEGAARSAALYARLTQVSAANPFAWSTRVRTAADVATVTADNRMIAEPYPLALNAMPHVDQAAAVLVTSVAVARELGVPEDRLVHVHGGAGATDTADVLERRSYAASDALSLAFDRALERTGWAAHDLDIVDVYSCFPVVPELVARHLRLPDDAVPSVTGGHAAFGGPLSSYSLHAIAAVTRRLRDRSGLAAVHANGGYLTEQHVTVLGSAPHPDGYVGDPVPVDVDRSSAPPVRDAGEVVAERGGRVELTIETWTVEHGRDRRPSQAFVIGRTPAGERVAASTAPGDREAAAALAGASLPPGATTWIGRSVTLAAIDAGPVLLP
jgi:acetyl-CoA C-acetyltransferase